MKVFYAMGGLILAAFSFACLLAAGQLFMLQMEVREARADLAATLEKSLPMQAGMRTLLQTAYAGRR